MANFYLFYSFHRKKPEAEPLLLKILRKHQKNTRLLKEKTKEGSVDSVKIKPPGAACTGRQSEGLCFREKMNAVNGLDAPAIFIYPGVVVAGSQ